MMSRHGNGGFLAGIRRRGENGFPTTSVSHLERWSYVSGRRTQTQFASLRGNGPVTMSPSDASLERLGMYMWLLYIHRAFAIRGAISWRYGSNIEAAQLHPADS